MDNAIIYIKLIQGCAPLKYINESLKSQEEMYYILTKNDISEFKKTVNGEHYLVAIEHNGSEIEALYIGKCHRDCDDNKLYYSILTKLLFKTAIKNLCKMSILDLNKDFNDDFNNPGYVSVEISSYIARQIGFIINKVYQPEINQVEYKEHDDENNLHLLAQRNEYCKRYYNYKESDPNRSEFQRDYERIVHSKAFRRMVDKAQVFSASKGDHYRTRMTHTQSVVQIARGISSALKLNMNLTEAIALGHDIGHTPFGHQGERTLDDILKGKIEIIKNCDLFEDGFGGFKHNYQSLRVASKLEEEYIGIDGLDLSYQTLEGIFKHTSFNKEKFVLSEFLECNECDDLLSSEYKFSSTLEGQVVAIADEIAQRGHDLDDALASGIITYDELKEFLDIKKAKKLNSIIKDVNTELYSVKEKNRRFCDENIVRNQTVVSKIISYFINDVIEESSEAMKSYALSEFQQNGYRVDKELISFSNEANDICKYVEIIVTNKVINSSEVAMFDSNASTIVKGLFKAYYNNPILLHKGTLTRISVDMRKSTQNVIDLNESDHEAIREELHKIVSADLNDETIFSDKRKCEYMQKRRIVVRNICDYISGMTDTYAMNEYAKIVK